MNHQPDEQATTDLSRRDFVALSMAAGLAAATGGAAAALPLIEKDVTIKTPDGECDAAFVYPASGAHPGVLIWPDAFGLRPAMRDMARRLAADGYAVLVPNPFYRVARAPMFDSAAAFNFADPADMAKLRPLMSSVNAPGAAEKDAVAYVAFLDAQPQVDKSRKIGTQGYCMGGPLVVKTAAAVPMRIGAGASFHGGGLVTDKPDSPHLLIPQMKAQLVVAIAQNDDARQPDAKGTLKAAFEANHVTAHVEVFAANHGWCVKDGPVYDPAKAEAAWAQLLSLYQRALA
jgi:carboxymethylenebutenolidase